MKKKTILSLITCLLVSCGIFAQTGNHFLTDEAYRNQVHQDFLARKKTAANRDKALFDVFNQNITTEEREALEFLYAYMPLSDLADYDGNYYLNQVRMAFKAKDHFDWGKKIPEDIFRHFVLVYRVNNENLDNAREVFFNELKDRVKGMTMEQAALEVNHWCHEKVTYRGTDGRTSAPLALMKTSWGRCGEESTFTTAAMRAVGIPARQCYTPRWAHTDDNHAWVEVWIDGQWHYIGACEPEPELDVAWFTGPAKRAMMVHTNVFGPYNGTEEKNVDTNLYSVINLLSNYTDVRTAAVRVVDEDGNPVEGATVKFKVYNYAEYYPIATTKTDAAGRASILTGKGDVLIWATDGKRFGANISSPGSKELKIFLDNIENAEYSEFMVMNAPAPQKIRELSPEKVAANAIRFAYEDSIRNAYMQTFIDENKAHRLAQENGLDKDNTWKYLSKSQGNWEEISSFILQYKDEPLLFPYLESLSEKDLRDTPCSYLKKHFDTAKQFGVNPAVPEDFVAKYVYSPRISNELIRPWREDLQRTLAAAYPQQDRMQADQIIDYLKKNISLNKEENYYLCPISPQGADELKISDARSLNTLFVALCRSQGIAARIEPSTSRPQYYSNNQWVNVNLTGESETKYPQGKLTFNSVSSNIVKPAYSTHYTIAKYVDGDFVTLDFYGEEALKNLPGTVSVDAGYYRLTTGSRANDGSVSVVTKYFNLAEGENISLDIKLPKTEGKLQVQGIVDPNSLVTLNNGTTTSLKPLMNGKGMILCFVDPGKEPSKHVLQDIPLQQSELEEWGGGILFVVPDDKASVAFDASVFKNLPRQSLWVDDANRKLLNAVAGVLRMDFSENFPLTVYLSSDGGILYSTQGYQIGIPENILKTIRAEQATKNP